MGCCFSVHLVVFFGDRMLTGDGFLSRGTLTGSRRMRHQNVDFYSRCKSSCFLGNSMKLLLKLSGKLA